MIDGCLLVIDIIAMLVLMFWSIAQERSVERTDDIDKSSSQPRNHSRRRDEL